MKSRDIVIGQHYIAKVNGELRVVRVDRLSDYTGWRVTNLATGRETIVKGPARFRRPASADEIRARTVLAPAESAIEAGLNRAERERESKPDPACDLVRHVVGANVHRWQIGQQIFCKCGQILDCERDWSVDVTRPDGELVWTKALCAQCWPKHAGAAQEFCRERGLHLSAVHGSRFADVY